ncbi:uncharacterized protein F5Z01DRAFT_194720 [Emericellopsis atlantica]|uniref:Uncharacterized protein n=1 Tax=Emericellopsis atlantica TaxID=2614577 RepID=A0A9P7ZUL8_9HYPO|nr:uncharacterized protein F5Z01DRAFT_194720 [Emericellopsis atlantica]KAG9258371.1 hypothetical protein F5Z01DRAFT_194720 [Emericellopsis atlantica]
MEPGSQKSKSNLANDYSPPWDRTLDIVVHKSTLRDIDQASSTASATASALSSEHRASSYAHLPEHVRRKICRYLVPKRDKPLTLSQRAFTKHAWHSNSFTPFAVILRSLESPLLTSKLLRDDILHVLFADNTVHVTLSPYTGPRISPLTQYFFSTHVHRMQNLILEVDLSKLGFGPEGADLRPGLGQLGRLLHTIGKANIERTTPLKNLTLLARRYHGVRPDRVELSEVSSFGSESTNATSFTSTSSLSLAPSAKEKQYYCPDVHLHIFDSLLYLKGNVENLRMCGFSDMYARMFIKAIFPQTEGRVVYRLRGASPWGRLSGQTSMIDDGKGGLVLDDHEMDPVMHADWQGTGMPPRPTVQAGGSFALPVRGIVYQAKSSADSSINKVERIRLVKKLANKLGGRPRVLSRKFATTS